MKNKDIFIYTCLGLVLIFSFFIISYKKGNNSGKVKEQNKENKKNIKVSESQETKLNYKIDSLIYIQKNKDKEIKVLEERYKKGKERIKYITVDRIQKYTDTLCKQDLYKLNNQLNICDTMITLYESQLVNNSYILKNKDSIIIEKQKQIQYIKNIKPIKKPFGIGAIAGYGSDFTNGLKPFIGIGLSYNIISL